MRDNYCLTWDSLSVPLCRSSMDSDETSVFELLDSFILKAFDIWCVTEMKITKLPSGGWDDLPESLPFLRWN